MKDQLDFISLSNFTPRHNSIVVESDNETLSIPALPRSDIKNEINPEPVQGKVKAQRSWVENLNDINNSYNFESFPDDQIAEIILGEDDRIRIEDTTSWPYITHGHMVMTFPNNKVFIGSGTVINKRHILTAGHCLFSKQNGGWAKSVMYYPAQNGSTLHFDGVPAVQLWSVAGWTENTDSNWDFGLMVLEDDVADKTGHLGIIAFRDYQQLLQQRVNVTGYPGDKGGKEMWTHNDVIKSASENRLLYDIDTTGGTSGATVYSNFKNDESYHVCAIHTTGHYSGNGATRISPILFHRIVQILGST